ncbi:hypothetical protein [Vagococcus sp.]|uniref:hypothetical protein n=1 Tax=Vagococcus sp. TaxID=1933889 RepID=UPI003F98A7F9
MRLKYDLKKGRKFNDSNEKKIVLYLDDEVVDEEGVGKIDMYKENDVVILERIYVNQAYREIGVAGYMISDFLLFYLNLYKKGFLFKLTPSVSSVLHENKTEYDIYRNFVDKPISYGIELSRQYSISSIEKLEDLKAYYSNKIIEGIP